MQSNIVNELLQNRQKQFVTQEHRDINDIYLRAALTVIMCQFVIFAYEIEMNGSIWIFISTRLFQHNETVENPFQYFQTFCHYIKIIFGYAVILPSIISFSFFFSILNLQENLLIFNSDAKLNVSYFGLKTVYRFCIDIQKELKYKSMLYNFNCRTTIVAKINSKTKCMKFSETIRYTASIK